MSFHATFIFLLLLISLPAQAYQVYADSQSLTAEQVMQKNEFKTLDGLKSFGATDDVYWLLFDDLHIEEDQQFWLHIANGALDYVQTYVVKENSQMITSHFVGDALPFSERPIEFSSFILPYTLEPTDKILVKLWGETPLAFFYKMGPSNQELTDLFFQKNVTNMAFGIMLAFLLYNLIMFLVTRIVEYAWYVVYMGGVVLFVTFSTGYGYQYIWPNSPFIQNNIAFVFICLFQFGAFGFTRAFLNLKAVNLKLDLFYKIATLVPLLMLATLFLDKGFTIKLVSLITFSLFLIVPITIVYTGIKKSKDAFMFLFPWVIMVSGMLIYNLALNGRVSSSFFTGHALEFGVAIESILLSFAIAYRIKNKENTSNMHLNLAYEQIKRSLVAVNKSNLAKDSFLTSVSHELKTPLHALLGNVQLLTVHLKDIGVDNKKLLNATDSAASNLFLHIDKLLTYSEIVAEDSIKIESTFELIEQIQYAQKNWSLVNTNDKVKCVVNIESKEKIKIKTDWVHCNKMILIVLEQAFNSIESGNIHVNVKITEGYLSFIVAGLGSLNTDGVSELFSSKELSNKWNELGFGFYLCQKMADLIGATIGYQQLDDTWEFTLDNPIEIEPFEEKSKKGSFNGRHILIVDDISVNLKLMEALVKALGATSVCVDRGQKALDALANESFDLVLMDCQMPGLSGQQTTVKIREMNHPCKDVPVIAVTANSLDQDRLSCTEAGMDDFIAKPIRLPSLSKCLSDWLSN